MSDRRTNAPVLRLHRVVAALVTVLLAFAGGCEDRSSASADSRLRVVATTTMIGDLVRQIGGEHVALRILMGAAVDPHTYKPTPADFEDLKRARIVFFNGLHLEGKMVDLLESRLKGRGIAVTRDIPVDKLLAWKAGEAGAHDPHVWFDIALWMHAARTVGRELSRVDPAHAADYERNLRSLLDRMDALHQEIVRRAAALPSHRRVLITSHDAFNYFGRAYGFDVRGLQGISTETEAGLIAMAGAVDFIVHQRIPAIFVESSVSPRTIQRVREDCRARGYEVRIGGELFSDALGAPGQHPGYEAETYLGAMRYNADTLFNALSSQP